MPEVLLVKCFLEIERWGLVLDVIVDLLGQCDGLLDVFVGWVFIQD